MAYPDVICEIQRGWRTAAIVGLRNGLNEEAGEEDWVGITGIQGTLEILRVLENQEMLEIQGVLEIQGRWEKPLQKSQ